MRRLLMIGSLAVVVLATGSALAKPRDSSDRSQPRSGAIRDATNPYAKLERDKVMGLVRMIKGQRNTTGQTSGTASDGQHP